MKRNWKEGVLCFLALLAMLASADAWASPRNAIQVQSLSLDTIEIGVTTPLRIFVSVLDTAYNVQAAVGDCDAFEIVSQSAARLAEILPEQVAEFVCMIQPQDSGISLFSVSSWGTRGADSVSCVAYGVLYISDTLKAVYSLSEAIDNFGTIGKADTLDDGEEIDTSEIEFVIVDAYEADSTWSDIVPHRSGGLIFKAANLDLNLRRWSLEDLFQPTRQARVDCQELQDSTRSLTISNSPD